MNLERELFRWWCTLVFRPEMPNPNSSSGGGNRNPALAMLGKLMGGNNKDNKYSNKDDDEGDSEADSSYSTSASSPNMKEACQTMAAWKLCENGPAIAKFCAWGGQGGAKNIHKTFGAELADPYAEPHTELVPIVEASLRVVARAMLEGDTNAVPSTEFADALLANVAGPQKKTGVASSLAYLRDRIGVPRDLPLASARYLRAYLNWGIDVLSN